MTKVHKLVSLLAFRNVLHIIAMEQRVAAINHDIETLLIGLGQAGLLDDQFAQLMQLQVHIEGFSLCIPPLKGQCTSKCR